MKAALRYLHSPDANDLDHYNPENWDDFCLFIQAMIGPSDNIGEESFDFFICTPKWINSEVEQKSFLFGTMYLIVDHYNYQHILKIIQELCDRTTGKNWDEIVNKLRRYGYWEFEDYQNIHPKN